MELNNLEKFMYNIQSQLHKQAGGRQIDVYYQEGKGLLAVYGGQPLFPNNVIMQIADATIQFFLKQGATIT